MESESSLPNPQVPVTCPYPELCVNISQEDNVLRRGVVSTSPNPQAGELPPVGCPRLLIHYVYIGGLFFLFLARNSTRVSPSGIPRGIYSIVQLRNFFLIYNCRCVSLEYSCSIGGYGVWFGCGWSCSIWNMAAMNLLTSTVFM